MSKNHIVRQGECLSIIATQYGFSDWRYLYDHPENAKLRKKRPNPNILFPGDLIKIPDTRIKEERVPTGQLHRFVVKSPDKHLRIVFRNPKGEVLSGEPYTMQFDSGRGKSGKTGGDGMLKEPVFLGESSATLEIADRVLNLRLGHLNPSGDVVEDDLSGIQSRLNNLGYAAGPADGIYDRNTRAALALVQVEENLEVSGLPDPSTLSKLEELHGC